jgi:hypothetical protein
MDYIDTTNFSEVVERLAHRHGLHGTRDMCGYRRSDYTLNLFTGTLLVVLHKSYPIIVLITFPFIHSPSSDSHLLLSKENSKGHSA